MAPTVITQVTETEFKTENPRALQKRQKKIKRLQQEVSRKKRGSKNRGKAVRRLARGHARVRNVRRDVLHKATTMLAKSHGKVVIEDLKVRNMTAGGGSRKRALATALTSKAPVEVVNPAYTSQECPSCGYISRSNRSGVKFHCRSCGRKAHADWVGASGILRRSGDNDIGCADRPFSVKATLQRRFRLRRTSLARSLAIRPTPEPSPLGLSLTTGGSGKPGTGIGSNLVPAATR